MVGAIGVTMHALAYLFGRRWRRFFFVVIATTPGLCICRVRVVLRADTLSCQCLLQVIVILKAAGHAAADRLAVDRHVTITAWELARWQLRSV